MTSTEGPADAPDPGPVPDAPAADRQDAVLRTVRELEQHVSAGGWDGPVRLFALIRTSAALSRDPELAGHLPPDVVQAAREDTEHLTAVEQENLPEADSVEALLGGIAWPDTVDGAALVIERIVVPPDAEADLPADDDDALAYLQGHPKRRDVRLAAAVLRDGTHGCAVRARDHDSPDRVAVAPDLVPGLVTALVATLG
ncbi:MAG TPA: PPA1309 family protein [Kineosporiaceae bacterium]